MIINKRILTLLIHIISWLGLLIFVEYTLPFPPKHATFIIHFKVFTAVIIAMALYYVNYFYLVRKFLFRKKILLYFISVVSIVIIAVQLNVKISSISKFDVELIEIMNKYGDEYHYTEELNESKENEVVPLIISIFVILIGTLIAYLHKSYKDQKKLELARISSELEFLKQQVSPHFLFNTLNNIYSLIGNNPTDARICTHNLSKLLRYSLYESKNKFVQLKMEIEFIDKYIEIQKMRMHESIKIDFISKSNNNFKGVVLPLALIPFVENAFKHGITNEVDSNIRVVINHNNKDLEFEVSNAISKSNRLTTVGGIGLNNVKRRLQLTYPDNEYELLIDFTATSFNVKLKLPIYD